MLRCCMLINSNVLFHNTRVWPFISFLRDVGCFLGDSIQNIAWFYSCSHLLLPRGVVIKRDLLSGAHVVFLLCRLSTYHTRTAHEHRQCKNRITVRHVSSRPRYRQRAPRNLFLRLPLFSSAGTILPKLQHFATHHAVFHRSYWNQMPSAHRILAAIMLCDVTRTQRTPDQIIYLHNVFEYGQVIL